MTKMFTTTTTSKSLGCCICYGWMFVVIAIFMFELLMRVCFVFECLGCVDVVMLLLSSGCLSFWFGFVGRLGCVDCPISGFVDFGRLDVAWTCPSCWSSLFIHGAQVSDHPLSFEVPRFMIIPLHSKCPSVWLSHFIILKAMIKHWGTFMQSPK